MRWARVLVVGSCVVVGSVMGAGVAAADDPGNSAAAHLCLDGLQTDYYQVVGEEPGTQASIDFGDLVHGIDREQGLAFVMTDSHGQCTSFFAQNKKKGKGSGQPAVSEIVIVKVQDAASAS